MTPPRPLRAIVHEAFNHAAAIKVACDMRLDDTVDPVTQRQRELWQIVSSCAEDLLTCLDEIRAHYRDGGAPRSTSST